MIKATRPGAVIFTADKERVAQLDKWPGPIGTELPIHD
jgi:hypothetical protein